jgi:hypothetical protein
LVGLADVAREQGHAGEAMAFYAEGLALYRQIGDQCFIARVLCRLANPNLEQDDWPAAQTCVVEILTIAQDTGQVEAPELACALEVGAALAERRGTPLQAVRLAAAAAALSAQGERPAAASIGGRPAATARPAWRGLTHPCPALSAAEQATAWAAGQAMTREQAIADALAGLPSEQGPHLPDSPERQRAATRKPPTQRLSRTERRAWVMEHLRTVGSVSPREYVAALGVERRTAVRDLCGLAERGVVVAQGTTTDRRYILPPEGS